MYKLLNFTNIESIVKYSQLYWARLGKTESIKYKLNRQQYNSKSDPSSQIINGIKYKLMWECTEFNYYCNKKTLQQPVRCNGLKSISVYGALDQVIFKIQEACEYVVDPWPKKDSGPDILVSGPI